MHYKRKTQDRVKAPLDVRKNIAGVSGASVELFNIIWTYEEPPSKAENFKMIDSEQVL